MGTPTQAPRTRAVQLLDGGTGEELFRRGMPDDRRLWSATALVHAQYHELLVQVHASFLGAGAGFITCNNYGVTPGVGFEETEIVRLSQVAGELATRARKASLNPTAKICGSLPPLLESYRPDRLVAFDEGVRLYSVIGGALQPYVDCFLAETLSTVDEAKMAITAAQTWPDKPVMVSFTLNTMGELRSGQAVVEAINELLCFSARVDGILFNCSQPEAISVALRSIQGDPRVVSRLHERNVRLGAYANRLTAIPDNWAIAESSAPQQTRADLDIEKYKQFVREWVELGADIVGGCCGIGPEYIARMDAMLRERGVRA